MLRAIRVSKETRFARRWMQLAKRSSVFQAASASRSSGSRRRISRKRVVMAGTQEDPSSRWATLIDAVKTPLNFFTLALLIAQGILVYLAQKAQGADFRILLVAAL